jgi:hypothetical protein
MKISELMTLHGSDKATEHSYGDFYDSLSSRPLTSILEVGVEAGHSMAAWKEKFPAAIVIGIDKDVTPEDSIRNLPKPTQRKIRGTASQAMLRHGDKFPPYRRVPNLDVIRCVAPDFRDAIKRFREEGIAFDLIIDDASHEENEQVLTYHYLKEFLSSAGTYVIEDLANDEITARFRNTGWEIIDLREQKGRWDDVLAIKYGWR